MSQYLLCCIAGMTCFIPILAVEIIPQRILLADIVFNHVGAIDYLPMKIPNYWFSLNS